MKMHNDLVKLYQNPKLNKSHWYSFVNIKRSEDVMINKRKIWK